MRPLELTIEGFRSYRDRVTFDWRDRRLVGVVGPIGAGKSSILDAISFALYGKTPVVEGATKTLIHQLADQSHVELRFQVDGQVWRAVRSLRRKGASGHQLELLAADEPDATVLEIVTLEGAMNERIQQLLGMDFKTFCRSVLLAQNRFAEFLKATPAQRDAVLKGVFGFERLDDALRLAKTRLDRVEMELASLERERERVIEARERLDEARSAAAAARLRLSALEAAVAEVEQLDKEHGAAIETAAAAAARSAALTTIAEALPSAEDVTETVHAAAASASDVQATGQALEGAARARDARETELADVASRLGDHEQFRSFGHLVQTHERQIEDAVAAQAGLETMEADLAAARSLVDDREVAAAAASASSAAVNASATAAAATVVEARDTLAGATHAEMAHALRATLTAGEPCPVCQQDVRALPARGAAPKVTAARNALAKAERREATARGAKEAAAAAEASTATALNEARAAASKVEGSVERATGIRATADAALAATKGQLIEWLGEEGDVRSLFEARQAELVAAEGARDLARADVEEARVAHEAAKALGEGATGRIADLATRLSGIWGRLGEDRDIARDPATLQGAFVDIGEAIVARHEQSFAERDEANVRAAEASTARAALLGSLGLSPEDDVRRALTDAGVAHGTASANVDELEKRIAAAGGLELGVRLLEARRGIAKRLADDLQPSRFLGFLLQEERTGLAELGSQHFEQLTDGAYRFTDDDRFEILDLNAAGTKRKADSLSGGETFLASLALALALAEMVARGGGRLDSFFLDEGFGGLDPDHLDRAMEGIGRLVSADQSRLVVLVSHVAEMREAIEDLVVLDKDTVTGNTVVVSGAAPA